MADSPCRANNSDDRVARIQAFADAVYGRDNSGSVEQAFDLTSQLNYAERYTVLKEELTPKLASPTTNGVREFLLGDIADMSHRPSEVLGDDVVTPVLDAYQNYQKLVSEALGEKKKNRLDTDEDRLDPDTLADLREDSGLDDAVEDARDIIDERFETDPERLAYGNNWLEFEIMGKGKQMDQVEKAIEAGQNNLSKNLLVNNLRAGIQNHVQLATTTIPEYGVKAASKARKDYETAVKNEDPELDFLVDNRFYDSWDSKYDFFSRPEHSNQGITYFAAKAKALEDGKSQAEAKAEGRKAVEKLQFKNRPGNRPRHYWKKSGTSRLSLLSYAIQMRRLHHNWIREIGQGLKENNEKAVREGARKVAYFYAAQIAINGVSSAIPDEPAMLMKAFMPETYNAIRKGDRFSLMGALDIDTAEIARIPITPLGYLLKTPVFYDIAMDTTQAAGNLMKNPQNPESWIKLFKKGSLFAPAIPVIGNKNAGNLLEYGYKTVVGDWDKRTPKGRKIESDPVTEFRGVLTGRPLGQSLQMAEKDAKKKKEYNNL